MKIALAEEITRIVNARMEAAAGRDCVKVSTIVAKTNPSQIPTYNLSPAKFFTSYEIEERK